jgi:polar amino acid transport system substrate-binding protein
MGRILLSIALIAGLSGVAFGQTAPASEIAPGGKLRVGMIASTGLGGVAEPVARFIGQKLGAAFEPVMYPNPEAYLQSFGKGEWDIAIGPRVPGGQGGFHGGPLARQPCLRRRAGKGIS